jgi:uncharacterized LabA/DUF88 family protein
MNTINSHNEVLLVVDQDQRFKDAQNRRKKIDPEREAETFTTLVKVLGRLSIRCALVSEHDEQGYKAYSRLGFEVIRVNGNRGGDVNRFITQHTEFLKNGRISHLVLVTGDSTFAFLANQADLRTTQISVWAPAGSISREMIATMPPFEFRDLDEILPASPKVAILVDFENVWYGLKKLGKTPQIKPLVEAIKSVGEEFGEIKKFTAYADWDLLSKEHRGNMQRDLVELDVDTQYLINIRGKNTADMRVANDIRDLVERGNGGRDEVDVIVLATGDRDFRDIVKTAMDRGKRVIILAVRNGVSEKLINVASEVRYLDELLKLPLEPKRPKYSVRPWSKYTLEVAKLSKYGRNWIPLNDLPTLGIQHADEFLKEASRLQIVKLEKRTEADGSTLDGFRLNAENLTVKVVTRMVRWVPDRIAYCLNQRKMPYIDSAFLSRGMTMDRTFRDWGVGQDRAESRKWLELLDETGIIQKKIQPKPGNEERLVTTWWPMDEQKTVEQQYSVRQDKQEPLAGSQPWPISEHSQEDKRKDESPKDPDQTGNLWTKLLGSPA